MNLLTSMPVAELVELTIGLVVAGVLTGILAGLFGVGGGTVIVPMLVELFRHLGVPEDVQMQLAVGTSLAIIVPTTVRSYRGHKARGAVDETVLKSWIVPAALGAIVGAAIAGVVSSDALKFVFTGFVVFMSANLLLGREHWRLSDDLPGLGTLRVWGFGIALLSALIGIGGGALATMALRLYNRPIHLAIGTSAGLGALVAVPGMIGYAIAGWPQMGVLPPLSVGFVSLIGFVLMAPISVLVAPLGVRIAHRLSKRTLTVAFGLFLASVAVRFIYDLLA